MDCSLCSQYCEQYNFVPINEDAIIMSEHASSSSAESGDETKPESDQSSSPANSTGSPPVDENKNNKPTRRANSGKRGGATDADGVSAEVNEMVDRVLEAVRQSPSDEDTKAVSVVKIKAYLQLHYRVRQAQMKLLLKPAMEAALRRKQLLKVTGKVSVLIGSVKLNPAHAVEADSESSSAEEDEPAPAVPEVSTRAAKRKVGGEDAAKGGKKRMKS